MYIGIAGAVLALDEATGAELWSVELKGSDFVNVALAGGNLYATARGEIYCLDAASGEIRWHNTLSGYGWGLISIATAGGSQAVLGREHQRRNEAANR